MICKIIIIILFGLSIQINAQDSKKFSDKINIEKFLKEYLRINKYKVDTEFNGDDIKKLVEKYAAKYRVDTNINDTIFILETCGLETRICYGSLWNKDKRIDFVIPYKKKIKFSNHRAFKEEERAAAPKWNKSVFNSLNKEGKYWINPDWHHATRIIISKSRIYVEREKYLY